MQQALSCCATAASIALVGAGTIAAVGPASPDFAGATRTLDAAVELLASFDIDSSAVADLVGPVMIETLAPTPLLDGVVPVDTVHVPFEPLTDNPAPNDPGTSYDSGTQVPGHEVPVGTFDLAPDDAGGAEVPPPPVITGPEDPEPDPGDGTVIVAPPGTETLPDWVLPLESEVNQLLDQIHSLLGDWASWAPALQDTVGNLLYNVVSGATTFVDGFDDFVDQLVDKSGWFIDLLGDGDLVSQFQGYIGAVQEVLGNTLNNIGELWSITSGAGAADAAFDVAALF